MRVRGPKRGSIGARVAWATVVGLWTAAGCSDDPVDVVDRCRVQDLPLRAEGDGPTVTQVILEVEDGTGVTVLATATDPQGTPDLLDVTQTIRVFTDERCEGAPRVVRDDLAGSGLEESFGVALEAATDGELFQAIASATTWPVEVEFRDAGGNVTVGRVRAEVRAE